MPRKLQHSCQQEKIYIQFRIKKKFYFDFRYFLNDFESFERFYLIVPPFLYKYEDGIQEQTHIVSIPPLSKFNVLNPKKLSLGPTKNGSCFGSLIIALLFYFILFFYILKKKKKPLLNIQAKFYSNNIYLIYITIGFNQLRDSCALKIFILVIISYVGALL